MSASLLGWSALHFAWQCALLVLIAVILLRCSGLSARVRYAVGCAALLLMAITPALTMTWLHSHAATAASSAEISGEIVTALDAPALHGAAWMSVLAAAAPWIGAAWMLGAALCLSHLMIAWRYTRRIRMHARPLAATTMNVAVPLLESADVDVPSALGCLRPVVLIPPAVLHRLSKAELESIITHELTHVRRRDPMVNRAQTVIECLLFFHPGVWWLSRQIRADREHCCDEIVVRILGQPLVYARALTRLEELRRHRLALAASGGVLLARVRHITVATSPEPRVGRLALAGMLLVLLSVFSNIAVPASASALIGIANSAALMYIEAHDDAGPFTVSVRAGRVIRATVNGREVPAHQLLQRGDSLRIIGDDGNSSFTVRLRPDGIVWNARSTASS
jgi:beta-lactamase regulating signal transducer with metallopeptidase domain